MSFRFGLGVAGFLGSASGSPPAVLIQGPVWDSFAGSGGLVGRSTEAGGAVYSLLRYTGTGDPTAASGGNAIGNQGASPQQGFAVITRSATNMRVRRTGNTLTTLGGSSNNYNLADHITAVGGSNVGRWIYAGLDNTTGALGSLGLRSFDQANVGTPFGTVTGNVAVAAGDNISIEYEGLDGGSPTGTVYLNGQRLVAASAIVTATNPITNTYGYRGGANLSSTDFMLGNRATDRFIELIAPGRNVGCRANGDLDMVLTFRCSIDAPASGSINYSFIDEGTGLPITGHDQQPVTNYQTGVTVGVLDTSEPGYVICRATTGLLTNAQYPAGGAFRVEIRRTDVTPGSIALSRSPILYRGTNLALTGQSLSQQMWVSQGTLGSGVPNTTPTNDWLYDATNQYATSDLDISPNNLPRVRTQRRTTATNATPNKQLAGVLQALSGRTVTLGLSGWGGTLQAARNNLTVNPTYRERFLLGLAMTYCRPTYIVDTSGQFELQDPANSANGGPYYSSFREAIDGRVSPPTPGYEAQLIAEQDAIDLLCGPTPRMICPINVMGGIDANQQELRRLQAITIPANNPSRFVRGPYLSACYRANTVNVTGFDVYHLSQTSNGAPLNHPNSGYGMQARRIARRVAFLRGHAANDANGPILTSAVRVGNTIEATFNPNGGTLAFRNGAYIGDYRGGLDFATDTGFTSLVFPTNCTVTGNVATFTFASLSSAIYVRSAWGSFPFARGLNVFTRHDGTGGSGTDAIHLNMPDRASMVCSEYNGAEFNDWGTTTIWVEVQPSFNAGGTGIDYVTAV